MYWIESIFMIAGISMDLFATMEVEGSMLARIQLKKLLAVAGLVMILQIGFFCAGYAIGFFWVRNNYLSNTYGHLIGNAIAMIGFGLLGVRLIIKAIKKDNIQEKRKEIPAVKYLWIIFVTTIYTLFAGCAQGLMGGYIWFMIILLIICSFAVTILGILTGYRYGFELKSWVYGFGAGLLWAAAIGILVIGIIGV